MSRAVAVDAPAKVNLALRVGARRADGYHDVDTLFAAVGLRDRLRIERAAAGIAVEVVGADLGDPRDNLVHRAARTYLDARGERGGVAVRLEKRIPVGGGLGGGSSDAAATLRCLDALFAPPMGAAALVRMARGLGADVPFFLSRSPFALGSGRGDRLAPLNPLPPRPVLLVESPQGVETAWAYGLLARSEEAEGRGARAGPPPLAPDRCRDWTAVAESAHNDFELPVFAVRPDLRETAAALRRTSPLLALMSGSGGTVFAVYPDEGSAARALHRIRRGRGAGRVHPTSTLENVPSVRAADAPNPAR